MNQYYHVFRLPACQKTNAGIIQSFYDLKDGELARRSHYFNGRYENIYLDRSRLSGGNYLTAWWKQCAAEVLGILVSELRCGFWFNLMGPGDTTTLHSHDDDDELLSGVYYLQVPAGDGGSLVLHVGNERITVEPEVGKLVLFAPDCLHEVTENHSGQYRLSIGINFGISSSELAPG